MIPVKQLQVIVAMVWWISAGADPRSCMEVKQCGEVEVDGEYWLYPRILQGSKIKVYCHEMETPTPLEYITLRNLNFGDYPRTCNSHCRGERTRECPSNCATLSNYIKFLKIRINILTMEVDRRDKTFTVLTRPGSQSGRGLDYGDAADCYNEIYNPGRSLSLGCGPKGEFKIDSTGTGLKFGPISHELRGWKTGKYITSSADDTVIHGYCGGYCGWCRANNITLLLNPDESLTEGQATSVVCPTTSD